MGQKEDNNKMARPAFCPSCGSTLSPTVQFCEQCGAPAPSAQPLPTNTPDNRFISSNMLTWLKNSKTQLLLFVPLIIVIYGMLFLSIAAIDQNITIHDNAGVLNVARVRQAAQELPTHVAIITASNFSGSTQAFDALYGNSSTSHQITLAIDTRQRHLAITGGKDISLSNSDYRDAVNTFASTFQQQGYTGATLATLDALKQDLYLSKILQDMGYPIKSTLHRIFGPVGTIFLYILLLLPLIVLLERKGSRRRGHRYRGHYSNNRSSGDGGGASGNF